MSARWLLIGWAWCVGAAAPAQDAMQVIKYQAADLVVPIPMDFTQAGPEPRTCEGEIMDLVRRMCAPESWQGKGGAGTIQYVPREMAFVVRHTPRVQEQVERLLSDLRRLQDREVCIEARLLALGAETVQALERAAERGGAGPLLPPDGPDGVCLSERERLILLALLQTDPATNVLQAPKVTMFSGQKGVLNVTDVVGAEPGDVDQDGRPVTKHSVGLAQALQPVIEHGRRTVRLATRTSVTELRKRQGQPRVFATRTLEHTYRIPEGKTLIAKLGRTAAGEHQYVTFTPRIIEQREETVGDDRPKRPVAKEAAFPRVFEVGDLVTPIRTDESSAAQAGSDPSRCQALLPERLIKLVTATVAQRTWAPEGGTGDIALVPTGQALVVRQTAEVHEEIEALLAALRRLQDLRVGLDCRIVSVPEAVARRINAGMNLPLVARAPRSQPDGAEEQPAAPAGLTIPRHPPMYQPPGAEEQDRVAPEPRRPVERIAPSTALLPFEVGARPLTARDSGALRRLLAEEVGQITETKLGGLGFNGQPLRLDGTTPRSTGVTEVKVTTVDGRLVFHPTEKLVRVGAVVEATPVLSADRQHVSMELNVMLHQLEAQTPARTVTIQSGDDKIDIGLRAPSSLTSRQLKAVVRDVRADGCVVLSLGAMEEGRRGYLIVTPRAYAE